MIKKTISFILFASLLFIGVCQVNAEGAPSETYSQLDAAGGGAGYGAARDPRAITSNIIRSVLSVIGILFICLILYAGFLWMTAGGNEEKVTKAKKLMYQSVIGLLIILTAYVVTVFIFNVALGIVPDMGRDSWSTIINLP